MTRLIEASAARQFQDSIMGAELAQVAVARAIAGAFGSETKQPPWPKWEDVKGKAKPYQVKQLLQLIETHNLQMEE